MPKDYIYSNYILLLMHGLYNDENVYLRWFNLCAQNIK